MAGSESGAAARRYAEAAFELGDEAGALDTWAAELDVLAAVARDPEAVAVLENAKQPLEQRLALLDRATEGLSLLVRNFARLLVTRNRLPLLPRIAATFAEMLDTRNGVVKAHITTAVPLSPDDQEAITERMRALTGARSVRMTTRVDPSIIGGLVARVGDQLIDGSTRSRLIELRKQLAGSAP